MSKQKKGIPITIGIASVWFGAHCGPGTASGRQTATYYNEFGQIGLLTPILAMALLGICIYLAIEYARLTKTYTFKEWANKFFSPHEKVFANIFEFTYIFTVLMVLGSCIATGASALNQYLSIPMIMGTFIIAGATLILAIFGAALVRASSSIMTFMILLALGVIIVTALVSTKGDFTGNYTKMAFATPSLFAAIWSALIYAGFQATGNIANTVSVAEGLQSRKESVKAAIYGVILNAALIFGIALILYAYPESIAEALPNYYIAEVLGQPLLLFLYVIVLLLAVLTTTVGFAFAVAARYAPLIKGMENGVKKDALITTIMLILCIGVSTFGLDKIVRVGFSYLGIVCFILVIIPVLFVGVIKLKRLKKETEHS
jgi:uncharacterized membrane protein YkvI